MKINEDCIRDVLKYFIENISLQFDSHNRAGFNEITLLETVKYFQDKYTKEEIWYSVYNLSKDYFVESNDVRKISRDVGLAYVVIYNVTHRGHQFYESIQPEPIWDKTKSIIGKVGNHTLGFIEQTAQMIAVESAKQAVTIAMTSKL